MVRVESRARKTKPSKKSKICRRKFLQDQKFSARREFVRKEKETEETIQFYKDQVKEAEQRYESLREEKKQQRITLEKEHKRLMKERDAWWKKNMDERDEKWEECWVR